MNKWIAGICTGCLLGIGALSSLQGADAPVAADRPANKPDLKIQMYAGLSVTGIVGKVYQVQYATELSDTNTWYSLQHFELKWNPYEFVDATCPATEKRFYRAVQVEVPTNVVPVSNMVFIPPCSTFYRNDAR